MNHFEAGNSSTPRISASFVNDILQLPSGLRLEASLSVAQQLPSTTSTKLAILLHPWSWLGGRMHDPVLRDLSDPLLSKGYHVLRYNSRGVGKSSGWPSLTGKQEAEDLRELVTQWVLPRFSDLSSLVILGYSHGSLIASLFPLLTDYSNIKISHIILSYPLGPRSWLTAFKSGHYTDALKTLLHNPRSNVLVLYSDHDDFTSIESYDAWVKTLKHEAEETEGCPRGNLEIVKVEGTNHFWAHEEARDRMLRTIREWVP